MRCSQQTALLLSIFLSPLLHACATAITRRADCCIGQCGDDDNGNQAPTLDGPTSDKSPGIGVEFETSGVVFESKGCDKSSTDKCKGKMVGGRQGENWMLTADTTSNIAGQLVAEYILDGTQIKLDTGKAAEAAARVADDIDKWNPFKDMQDPKVDVENSNCNPWTIVQPSKDGAIRQLPWAMQATAPLPLEAIHDLFRKAVANEASPLLPGINSARNMAFVTKDFFQANPNGISPDSVRADVLGFFSLVLSYAKGASKVTSGNSAKNIISIMPRTDWTNLFNQIRPAVPGELYDLVKVLACYRYFEDGAVEIDHTYCEGTVEDPKPNGQMDKEVFSLESDGKRDKCSVKVWIKSIQDNRSPDRLSEADKVIDGSIGGLGNSLENVLNTNRAVPLFEFRSLAGVKAANMEDKVTKAEQAVIDYHHAFSSPPQRLKHRRSERSVVAKRQDPCGSPSPSSATPKLTCTGVDNIKWMGPEALKNVIPTFCEDAEKQGVLDKDSGSLVRSYNVGGVDAVTLSIDWPSGADFRPQKDECIGFMTTVMDSCDGNDPEHNPLNWKHGGSNQVADVRYNVIPTAQRYKAGTCSMHVHEKEYFYGVDGPGTSRSHTFYLRVDAEDSAGKTVATVDNDVEAGDANPYHLKGYYNDLVMTPEAQGDYIQFALVDQYWSTTKEEGTPRCKVGGWDADFSPVARDMDCWFHC
ncbi:MAG: hypothetical protein Q9198_001467 [Flavoplaca austrocitrina]